MENENEDAPVIRIVLLDLRLSEKTGYIDIIILLVFVTYSHRLSVRKKLMIETCCNYCYWGKLNLSIYLSMSHLGILLTIHNHKEYILSMATYSTLSAQLIKLAIEKTNDLIRNNYQKMCMLIVKRQLLT